MVTQPTTQLVQLPNFRPLPGQQTAKVFRSGALSELTTDGQQELTDHGIGIVIDLREPYEIAAAPDQMDQSTYLSIPLYRGQVPLAAAIDDVYRLLLMERGHQIATAVQAITQYLDQNVVVHCKAGKDRTGLVVALMLASAGVSEDEIVADYRQSAGNLSATYRQQLTDQLETELVGNPAGFETALHLHLASPRAAVQRALRLVEANFGSAQCYLATHGVTDEQLSRLTEHFSSGRVASR